MYNTSNDFIATYLRFSVCGDYFIRDPEQKDILSRQSAHTCVESSPELVFQTCNRCGTEKIRVERHQTPIDTCTTDFHFGTLGL